MEGPWYALTPSPVALVNQTCFQDTASCAGAAVVLDEYIAVARALNQECLTPSRQLFSRTYVVRGVLRARATHKTDKKEPGQDDEEYKESAANVLDYVSFSPNAQFLLAICTLLLGVGDDMLCAVLPVDAMV